MDFGKSFKNRDMLGALLASAIGLFSIRRDLRWFIPRLTGENEEGSH